VKYALEAVNKGVETTQQEGLSLEASYFGLCAATEDKKKDRGVSPKAQAAVSRR